jgi:uncharacterized membrane protein
LWRAIRWADSRAGILLSLGICLYVLVFTAAAWYKYRTYGMGFDLAVHEQVLWNTAHGRIAASSPSLGTSSYFGIDIIITELLLTPLYALFPGVQVLLLAQTVALAMGALPVFRMAKMRIGSLAGLALAAAYLLYAPVEWMNLYEFQIRAFATTFLLLALEAFWNRRPRAFLVWSLLALGCRSDVGLVMAGLGVYVALELWRGTRPAAPRQWVLFAALPVALGVGWVALCMLVLIPAFRVDGRFLYAGVLLGEVSGRCGNVPGVGLLHPICLANYVFAPGDGRGALRWLYLFQMFLPLAFLPLLAPRALIPTLPMFAINLLSNTPNIHASTHYHYQALIIPFMLAATIEALARIGRSPEWGQRAAILVLALSFGCNLSFGLPRLGFGNPFFTLLTAPNNPERAALAQDLIGRVPPSAPLAVTSRLGPYLARREGLYVFPGDDIIYPTAYVARAAYILVDTGELNARDRDFYQRLVLAGGYERLAGGTYPAGEIVLWQRGGR